ncbi:TPM domain-containing protein [uncultured Sphingomonas sp.]|uniref:TPM domain-containing protein n=1 Tax=uncultured Sphingomonas sp. TaxID=158754 RepID=UPI0035CA61B5
MSEADHAAVGAAVTAAEKRTDGEIVTVVAPQSDSYHDVALHWAVLAMLGMLALLAAFPWTAERGWALVDPWATRSPTGGLLAVALVLVTATFLLARLLLAWMPLRLALTPGSTEARRVRRRAVELFRVAAERQTRARTGVMLYLSLAERRAEIIADAAIYARVAPEVWGEAMGGLLTATRDGRPGEGMAAAVERIGAVLAEHFPRTEGDINELSDRLVEL